MGKSLDEPDVSLSVLMPAVLFMDHGCAGLMCLRICELSLCSSSEVSEMQDAWTGV